MKITKFIVFLSTAVLLTAVPLTVNMKVSAQRLDPHDGYITPGAPNILAYTNNSCTASAHHYLCPGDWYSVYDRSSSGVKCHYPVTIPLKNGTTPKLFFYWFRTAQWKQYADGATGYFNVPFNTTDWYNHLPGDIGYIDLKNDGGKSHTSMSYAANNYEIYTTSTDYLGHRRLKCKDNRRTNIMYADYIPSDGQIYYDHSDQEDADWHFERNCKSWDTDNLHQGTNTVWYAGTDACGNYAVGSRIFHYDTLKPICSFNYDPKTSVLKINADDDKSLGAGSYSGLNYFQYRLSKDNGNTWTAWSGKNTAEQSITLKDSGIYAIDEIAYDKAGNKTEKIFSGIIKRSPPIATIINNTYHTDIDVISSINVKNTSTLDILPADGFTVKLDITGITAETKSLIVPANSSQTVWFKWHTPNTAQKLTGVYTIHSDSGDIIVNATFDVTKLDENTPPNPQGTDKMPNGFTTATPGGTATPSRSWNEWTYENNSFKQNTRTAALNTALAVTADSHNPTAFISNGMLNMKSGYGIAENVTTSVVTNAADEVTPCQNVIGMYPEFQYNTYYRLFDTLTTGTFQLKNNKYSMYNSRTHFTPAWWKNGVDYIPETYNIDAWTPAGMLTSYSTDTVKINGSVYDDWHVWPKN